MNNRYRNAPGLRGPTRATASTVCQKCLKRGHYSYECNVSAQDRPYLTRPSRTQQLQNPNLKPKLSTEVPNDLLPTKGLADELLSKREEERGRKRDRDVSDSLGGQDHMSKRARSESSHSMNSVSTISTSRSHSRSPPRHSDGHDRTGSRHSRARKRQYSDSSSGRSVSSSSSHERIYSQSHEWTHDRNTRRRRQESSPGERGRARELSRNSRQRNKSRSRDRGLIAKGRRSMTPEKLHEQNYPRRHSRDNTAPSEPSHNRFQSRRSRHDPDNPASQPRRERSLSPFSKRLALTQAMNAGK